MMEIGLLVAGVQVAKAGITPLPVHITNFPTPAPTAAPDWTIPIGIPHVDPVWATFWVATLALLGVVIAVIDLNLNLRQYRKADLRVTLSPDVNRMHFAPVSWSPGLGLNQPLKATFELQITNVGKKAAEGCYVTVYIPKPLTFEWTDAKWTTFTMMESVQPEKQSHRKLETFIQDPIYVGHPIQLPKFNVQSPNGEVTFDIRWQVNSLDGPAPDVPGYITTGIQFSEPERTQIRERAERNQT